MTTVPLRVRAFVALPDDAPDDAADVELVIDSAELDGDVLYVYVKLPESRDNDATRVHTDSTSQPKGNQP